jgi:hypothetical protein
MTTSVIWVVVGATGEYSDYMEWNVAGYPSESQAISHRDAAQLIADSHKKQAASFESCTGLTNPHDPQYSIAYTGTRYRVEMLEVFQAFNP